MRIRWRWNINVRRLTATGGIKDDDPGAGLLVEKYYIPEGWRGQGKSVAMYVIDDDTKRVSEEVQYRGVTLFSVANAGENKAYSDRLWPKTAYEYFSTNAAAAISYDKACTPYGASDLNSAPSENDVVKQSDTCGDDKPEDIPGGQQLWKGGMAQEKEHLKIIFAKSYGRYAQSEDSTLGRACRGAARWMVNYVQMMTVVKEWKRWCFDLSDRRR